MKKINFQFSVFPALLWMLLSTQVYATSYELQNSTDSIVGQLNSVVVGREHTMLDIARKHGFGYNDLKLLNPDIDTWLPEDGDVIQLPSRFILPNVPRDGIVMNIPEMRMYYFPPRKKGEPDKVYTYPLGVGREGWATPYKQTRIIGKRKHPDWRPPESIRKEHEDAGDPLPVVVKAGPDNPLGDHALRLGLPAYLIHGTNKPWGVGMRVSHGCIRLYPEDIAELFDQVRVGTAVNIINNPYKIGEADGVLYLEAHPPLTVAQKDEYGDVIERLEENTNTSDFTKVVEMIVASTTEDEYVVDWSMAKTVSEEAKGIPVAIGFYIPKQAKNSQTASAGDAFFLKMETDISDVKITKIMKDEEKQGREGITRNTQINQVLP